MDTDYKAVFRRLEETLREIERSPRLSTTLERLLEAITTGLGRELGVVAARIFRLDEDEGAYVLERQVGEFATPAVGFRIPHDYAPIRILRDDGFVFMEKEDPELDPSIEGVLEAGRFAAIALGEPARHLVSFTIDPSFDPARVIHSLNTIRHVLNLKIRQDALVEAVEESRRIQMSLLPRKDPDFPPYEIHGRSEPAETVGGDLFDFVRLSEKMLGLAVADASGHGLPAALQARDVITGLRVGLEVHFKLVWTIQRINEVISRSNLSSRFISLFYAEIERNGNLVYCNAGHPPPLLFRDGKIVRLRKGGLVLGIDPKAAYERGFVSLRPGSSLLLYTDGITEALSPGGEAFGEERLVSLLREHAKEAPALVVSRVFEAVDRFTRGSRLDDQTVVAVRRTAP